MQDIGYMLNAIMKSENCNSMHALFILTGKDKQDGLCILQPESSQKAGRRLRDKGDIQIDRARMG